MTDRDRLHQSFDGNQWASATKQHIQRVATSKLTPVLFPVPEIADYVRPGGPRTVYLIHAQSSHGKTLLIRQWLRDLDARVRERGSDEIIIYVDTENDAEFVGMERIGRDTGLTERQIYANSESRAVADSLIGMTGTSIVTLSTSITENSPYRELHLSNIVNEIDWIRHERFGRERHVAAVFIDYLQALPPDPDDAMYGDRRYLQVRNGFFKIKDELGSRLACPIIVAAQSKQRLDNPYHKNLQIPGLYDVQESSAPAQRATVVITLCRPSRVEPDRAKWVEAGPFNYRAVPELVFLRVEKQQGDYQSGAVWALRHDFEKGILVPDSTLVSGNRSVLGDKNARPF